MFNSYVTNYQRVMLVDVNSSKHPHYDVLGSPEKNPSASQVFVGVICINDVFSRL